MIEVVSPLSFYRLCLAPCIVVFLSFSSRASLSLSSFLASAFSSFPCHSGWQFIGGTRGLVVLGLFGGVGRPHTIWQWMSGLDARSLEWQRGWSGRRGRRVGANPESGVVWRSLEGQFSWVHYGRGISSWNVALEFPMGSSSHCGLGSSSVPPTSEFSVLDVDFTGGHRILVCEALVKREVPEVHPLRSSTPGSGGGICLKSES